MKKVQVYTDGSADQGKRIGGWAAKLIQIKSDGSRGATKVIAGGAKNATNCRMELTAVVNAIKALKVPCVVTIYSDSKYVVDGSEWAHNWKNNGWKTSTKQPVKNEDLWRELLKVRQGHRIKFMHVKGHAGQVDNEEVDGFAKEQMTLLRDDELVQ